VVNLSTARGSDVAAIPASPQMTIRRSSPSVAAVALVPDLRTGLPSSMTFVDLPAGPAWVPDACTLPTAQQPLRVEEFDELLGTAVTAATRTSPHSLRLQLTPSPEVAAATAALATRESRCCAFFTFTMTIAAEELHLDIAVAAGAEDVLDALARRATRQLE
jgi:hypothetical protein